MQLKAFAAAAALVFAVAGGACLQGLPAQAQQAEITAAQPTLHTEPLTIETTHGPKRFTVEIANDDNEREIGLMFRKRLGDNEGMLFEFDQPAVQSFWMKNTLIPLDMVFIGADGRIVSIIKNAGPKTLDPRTSKGPATGVLELRGGLADQDGIRPGDRVQHPFFTRRAGN